MEWLIDASLVYAFVVWLWITSWTLTGTMRRFGWPWRSLSLNAYPQYATDPELLRDDRDLDWATVGVYIALSLLTVARLWYRVGADPPETWYLLGGYVLQDISLTGLVRVLVRRRRKQRRFASAPRGAPPPSHGNAGEERRHP